MLRLRSSLALSLVLVAGCAKAPQSAPAATVAITPFTPAPLAAPTPEAPVEAPSEAASAPSAPTAPTTEASPERSDSEIIETYLPAWKAALVKKAGAPLGNGFGDVVHVIPYVERRNLGVVLRVIYTFKLGWLETYRSDEVLVRIDVTVPGQAVSRWLPPSDLFAEQTMAGLVILPNNRMNLLPLGKALKFPSRSAAARAAWAGTTRPKSNGGDDGLAIELPTADPRAGTGTPDIFLTGRSPKQPGTEECVEVRLSLTTGKLERKKAYCGRDEYNDCF